MKAWTRLCGCALVGFSAFGAGLYGPTGYDESVEPAMRVPPTPRPLPNASELASKMQARFSVLPPTLWMPQTEGAVATTPALPSAVDASTRQPASTALSTPSGQWQPEPDRFPAQQVSDALSGSISAIIRANGETKLVVADKTTTVRQVYRVGDQFAGTWRITQIQSDQVTLARNGQMLNVPVSYSAHFQRGPAVPSRAAVRPARDANPSPPTESRRRITRRIATAS